MKLQRTVAEVAALVGGRVEGPADRLLRELLPLEQAGPEDLAALFRQGALERAGESRAGCLLLGQDAQLPAGGRSLVRVADPAAAMEALVLAIAPRERRPAPGVDPRAVVEPGAAVSPEACVMAGAFVGPGARIGPRTVLRPDSYVGEEAVIGADCELQANAVVAHHCVLGDRVVLKPCAVVGADGFGFRQDARGRSHKIPQAGIVILGDDVELGAGTNVDRARFDATRIGRGCKIDAQVHVGHNVSLGEDCLVAGNVGIAGSARIGSRVWIGGMAGIGGDLVIGDDCKIAGMSMVHDDVAAGSFLGGMPARPHVRWGREMAALKWLPELVARHRREQRGREQKAGGRDA